MVDHRDRDQHESDDQDANHLREGVHAGRRERVIDAVSQRIAAAPPRVVMASIPLAPRVWVDINAWRAPALAAAALVMLVSGVVILKTDNQPSQEMLAGTPGGLPAPVARYLETGIVAPMDWLNAYGGRP